ncbi:MAG: patatin-like phospholipase family protein [Candidatus Peribacteraceae bacterium]|nr:patatin-like phospholipase family protein [Candidatus Peribacteraceae bacterium]
MSWGLVLSGGAAFGIANGGVLEVLEREGLKPDCIAGSSMGAIIAAGCAFGISLDHIHEAVRQLTIVSVARFSDLPLRHGLHSGIFRHEVERLMRPFFGDATIGDCRIPFVCVAGKVHKRIAWSHIVRRTFRQEFENAVSHYVFPPETRLVDALAATSAIPVVFSPVEIAGQTFVDLCHFGPIPARALKDRFHPDRIVATDTHPTYDTLRTFLPTGWREFLEAGDQAIAEDKAVCDVLISPVPPYVLFRFDKGEAFWEAGKKAAEKSLPHVKALIYS